METKCFCGGNNLFPLLKTLLSGPNDGRKWHIYSNLSKIVSSGYGAECTDYVGLVIWFLQTDIV